MKDATCPALHAALQAAEKGVPFMPLRGLIGSDVLKYRDDWKVIDNPFGNARSDRAAAGDQAGRGAVPCADGRPLRQCLDRPAARTGHHGACGGEDHRRRSRKSTTAICSTIRCSPPARCRASMSRASRSPSAAPGRCRCPIITPPTPSILPSMRKLAATEEGFAEYLEQYVYDKTRGVNFRDEELLADVIAGLIGDVRHVAVGNASPIPATAALLARERGNGPALRVAAAEPQAYFLHRRRARTVRLRRARPHRRVLPLGRPDRRRRQRQSGVDRRLRASARCASPVRSARPISITWFPKLFCSAVEHSRRTLVPTGRFHQRAGRERRRTSIARAGRSRWSPTAACSRSPMAASGWRACIPATRSTR